MQYAQQALHREIYDQLRFDRVGSWLVSYESQQPNQLLAREGSITGSLATLDLSEASDRVLNQHVRALMWGHTPLWEMVSACRSQKADVPGHGVIPLVKFASMGSALCFPIEAMVFATAIFMGIERELNTQLTLKDVMSFKGRVRVYGDDIIIPVEFVESVSSVFKAMGFKINQRKSFWTGKFRESCGKDYYDGFDVSVVKVRRDLPSGLRDVPELVSTVSLRNHFYEAGYYRVVDWLDNIIGGIIPFPIVESTSPGLGRLSHYPYQVDGMDPYLHQPFVKAAVVKYVSPINKIDDHPVLVKYFTHKLFSDKPIEDMEHLIRSGRAVTADRKSVV